jgi:hypothetical protein
MKQDITLTRDEVIKYIRQVRAALYSSQAKAMRRRNFTSLRPSEQAMTEVQWQSQLIALDAAVEAVLLMSKNTEE